jgi:hypothetical protein
LLQFEAVRLVPTQCLKTSGHYDVALGSAAIFSSRKAEVPGMQTFGNAIRRLKETKTRNNRPRRCA